jgi:hypothetical protein
VRGWSERGLSAGFGWLEAMLSVLFFVCTLAYVGPFKRAAKKAAKDAAREAARDAEKTAAENVSNGAAKPPREHPENADV